MSLERLEVQIRNKLGRSIRPTFFVSDSEGVKGAGGTTVRYWVVGEDDGIGLQPGLYVQTNLIPEHYGSDPSIRDAIGAHVVLDLMERSQKTASVGEKDVRHLDYENGIKLQQCAIASNGAAILRLTSAGQDEIKLRIEDVESGNTRMKFTLL